MSLIAGKSVDVCVCMCVRVRTRLHSCARLSLRSVQALLLRERTSDGAAGPARGNGSEVDEVKNCGEASDVKEEESPPGSPPTSGGRSQSSGKMDMDRRE